MDIPFTVETSDLPSCQAWHEAADAFAQAIMSAHEGGPPVELSIGDQRYVLNGWSLRTDDHVLQSTWVRRADLIRRCKVPLSTLIHMPWRAALGVIRRRMVRL